MKLPDWWPEFLTLRPRSAYQSQENPLQIDRLPDAGKVELDLPTRKHSPEENRHYVRRFLWLLAFIGLAIGLWESTYSTRLAPDKGEKLIFLGALAVYLYYDATISRRFWQLVPLLLLYLFALNSVTRENEDLDFLTTPFLFLVATICALRLAERICQLNLYLFTTAPTPKESAARQRAAWRWRYLVPFLPGPRGLDFYALGVLLVLAPAVLFYFVFPTNSLVPGAVLIATTLSTVCLLPLVLEFCASYFVGRSPLPISRMWRGMWYAVGEWFTYDRHDSKAPGVFKSPLGTHKQRWRMAFAAVVMLTVAIAQYTGWWRAIFHKWDEQNRAAAEAQGTEHEPDRFVLKLRDVHLDFTSQVDLPATESDFIQDGEHHYLTTYRTVADQELEDSHDFGWGFLPEQAEELQRKLDEINAEERLKAKRREQRQQKVLERFTPGEPTGSYVEDQKNRDQVQWNVVFTWLHGKVIWFYPVAATAMVPGWLFLAYAFAVCGRFAGGRHREVKVGDPPELATADDWEKIVERVRRSDDKDEKKSIFVGVNAADHTPVLVPSDVFREHAHILGDSGSGKTALGIAPLMTQLIRFEKYSIVVVDLKADEMSLFTAAKGEAAGIETKWQAEDRKKKRVLREYPFRWFTSELGKTTFAFNPLRQSAFRSLSLSQKTDLLTAALGVQYGTDYGRSYFSDANSELVRLTLQAYPNVPSFRHLALAMEQQAALLPRKQREASSHVLNIVRRLGDTEALNIAAGEGNGTPHGVQEHAIDFLDVFLRPQALYFYLPSALGTTSNAEIARLALYSLLTAAKHAATLHQTNGHPTERTQVFLFIDEFQRIVSHNLELFLQQARSMDIGVILANQTLADLETADTNLIPSVRANCRFKQMFSVTDVREQEDVSRAGGDMVFLSPSITQHFKGYLATESGYSVSTSEQQINRLSPNDILLAGDHNHHSIVQIRRGAGYAQFGGMPFVLYSQFHISKREYDERRLALWPKPEGGTFIPTPNGRPLPPVINPPLVPIDEPVPIPPPDADDDLEEEAPETPPPSPDRPADVSRTQSGSQETEPPPGEHPLDIFAAKRKGKPSSGSEKGTSHDD